MLNFVNHYYEVTEENIDQLRQMIMTRMTHGRLITTIQLLKYKDKN